MGHFEIMEVMGRAMPKIPKKYRYIVMKEMEEWLMLRRIDKKTIQLTGGNIDAKLESYGYSLFE